MSPVFAIWAMILLAGIRPHEEIRFASVFEQQSDASCGVASAVSLASIFWNVDVGEKQAHRILYDAGEAAREITMHDLKTLLELLGFTAGGFRLDYGELAKAVHNYGPLIVHLAAGEGHFALFLGEVRGFAVLGDPSRGCLAVARDEFLVSWTHTALAVVHPERGLAVNELARATEKANDRLVSLLTWCRR